MLDKSTERLLSDVGLLILRAGIAAMMLFGHGWGKFDKLMAGGEISFADPFGMGPTLSLVLAVFAEFFCSILVAIGLVTRAAAVPLLITMLTAALIIHADDPWGKKEFALLYAVPFLTLILTGAGRLSVDGFLKARRG